VGISSQYETALTRFLRRSHDLETNIANKPNSGFGPCRGIALLAGLGWCTGSRWRHTKREDRQQTRAGPLYER
jgi:hypothetical protein